MGELKLLVLKTGENLMGTVTNQNEGILAVEDIVAFAPKQDGTGVMTIPYLQFSLENETTFNVESDIRHVLTPNKDLADYYNKQFSKIIIPDSKLMNPTMMGVD